MNEQVINELTWLQMKLSVQESTLSRVQATLRDAEEQVRCLKDTVAQQQDDIHAGEMERRRLHNTIQELKVSHQVDLVPGLMVSVSG